MAYLASDLPSFPDIPLGNIQEAHMDLTFITTLDGFHEIRRSYADWDRKAWDCSISALTSSEYSDLIALWESRKRLHPFKITINGETKYVRFDAAPQAIKRGNLYVNVSFRIIEVNPAEVIE